MLFLDKTLQSDHIIKLPAADEGTGFIAPNEKNIGRVRTIFAKAFAGLYVSVGTERGFMGAALSKAKALVLVDTNRSVVLYNLVNKSLLELAKSRKDYLEFRLNSTFDALSERVTGSLTLSSEGRELLSRPEVWEWWTQYVQKHDAFLDFHDAAHSNFRDANYLFNDQLFNSISALAKAGRIFVYHSNLKSEGFHSRLAELTFDLGLRVSVLDISNAWDYMGPASTISMIRTFNDLNTPDTFFVFTYLTSGSDRHANSEFKYFVARNGDYANLEGLAPMFGALKQLDPSRSGRTQRARVGRFGHDH